MTANTTPDEGRKADLVAKHKFYKAFNVSMAVAAVAMLGIIGAITIDNTTRPIYSTANYHFNLQYRAGYEEPMNGVVNNSLIPILLMYQRHPAWRANVEFQGQMLEWMEHMDDCAANGTYKLHGDIDSSLELLKNVTDGGQVQLILIQYSSALAVAYPYLPWYKSLNYTQELLQRYNITRVSRCVLLQEGQFFFGVARAMADFTHPNGTPVYDTIMGLREILSFFHVTEEAPLYTWTVSTSRNTTLPAGATTTFKVFPYWILPFQETGVYYWNIWCQDGENVNTGFEVVWEDTDFAYSDYKLKNHENQIAEMERLGNKFLTCDEWVQRAEDLGQVQPLDSYVPETHWQVFNYRSQFVWMGENGDIDDGQICAMLYRTFQILQGVELMLNFSRFKTASITQNEYEAQYDLLYKAWIRLADGMVTDVTGLSPGFGESMHAYKQANISIGLAAQVRDFVVNRTAALNASINGTAGAGGFQVVPFNFTPLVQWDHSDQTAFDWTGTVVTDQADFLNFTSLGSALPSEIGGLAIEEVQTVGTNISRYRVDAPFNPSLDGLEYIAVTTHFKEFVDGDLEWNYLKFIGNFSTISYSPTMYENETIDLARAGYYPDVADPYGDWAGEMLADNFEFFLPCSNGLIFSQSGGFAIVKNCSASHITGKWNADGFRYMQTRTNNETLPFQVFVLPATTLQQALDFANLVNTWAPVTITGGALK
ncbi:MAG: hypothetical protein JW839_10935 [Candidatus Lokiarchaeota archaeon]|nr:hypothetical protein [Candidatus Lokiarchaeota archaeon]